MLTPLLVIDVQPDFLADLEEPSDEKAYLREVCRVVRQAVKQKRKIILLEYEGAGTTHVKVRSLLKAYPHKIITKLNDDGGEEVHAYAKEKKITSFTVIGMNLDCCVSDTVKSLLNYGYSCRILGKATINAWEGYLPPPRTWLLSTRGRKKNARIY